MRGGVFLFLLLSVARPAFAGIETNAVSMANPPAWLTPGQVESTVSRIQAYMEWDIRKVTARWYSDQTAFLRAFGLASGAVDTVVAFSRKDENAIYLGPRVVAQNFAPVFGHELVHIIVYQKYGNAIPDWLNEGLANFVAQHGTVDYRWLATQPPRDVTSLKHPFQSAQTPTDTRYHYEASQAVMEMLSAKCDIHSLFQLSVGQTLESHLATLCEIPDLNAEFRKWIAKKAAGA